MNLTERAVLDLTRRIGIDWRTPLRDYKMRGGVRRWFDFLDVIDVPLGQLSPSIGGTFFVRYRPDWEPWPPTSYEKDIFAKGDVIAQHTALAAELEAILGVGTPDPSVNVVGAAWKIGPFTIRILTFLRDKTQGPNPLYERHPILWQRTSVEIETSRFSFEPDSCLARFESLPPILSIKERPPLEPHWFAPLIKRSINPLSAPSEASVRLNRTSNEIAISRADLSLVLVRSACVELHLIRMAPARGGGFSVLDMAYRHPEAPERVAQLSLLRSSDTDGLDHAASTLANVLGLPCKVVNDLDY